MQMDCDGATTLGEAHVVKEPLNRRVLLASKDLEGLCFHCFNLIYIPTTDL